METVVPWSELEALIAPYYPKAGNGRQPVGLSIMLRIYFLQHWFNLCDPAVHLEDLGLGNRGRADRERQELPRDRRGDHGRAAVCCPGRANQP